jgi:hypothetical protein
MTDQIQSIVHLGAKMFRTAIDERRTALFVYQATPGLDPDADRELELTSRMLGEISDVLTLIMGRIEMSGGQS